MDDLGFNKIAGAVLSVGLGMLVLMKLPGLVMGGGHHDDVPFVYGEGAALEVAAAGPEIDLPFPQPDWVAAMDEARGAKVFKKCKSCHNNADGGKNGTGPNLYALLGTDVASKAGYDYSAALKGLPGEWSYEALDGYLKKPSEYAPGTKMNFIGLKKAEDRAAVIEYLRVGAATPMPRPEPQTVNADTMEASEMATDVVAPVVPAEAQSMEQPTVDPSEGLDTATDAAMEQKKIAADKLKELE